MKHILLLFVIFCSLTLCTMFMLPAFPKSQWVIGVIVSIVLAMIPITAAALVIYKQD